MHSCNITAISWLFYMNLNMWKTVSYSAFVQWCAEVLWAERKGLHNREMPMWSECKCSCNLKRAECFSRARVCQSASVPEAARGKAKAAAVISLLLLVWAWKISDRRFSICFLLPPQCRGHQAGPASSPAAPCGSFFRAGRLRPRTHPHHPLLGCLSLAEKNHFSWEKHQWVTFPLPAAGWKTPFHPPYPVHHLF